MKNDVSNAIIVYWLCGLIVILTSISTFILVVLLFNWIDFLLLQVILFVTAIVNVIDSVIVYYGNFRDHASCRKRGDTCCTSGTITSEFIKDAFFRSLLCLPLMPFILIINLFRSIVRRIKIGKFYFWYQ